MCVQQWMGRYPPAGVTKIAGPLVFCMEHKRWLVWQSVTRPHARRRQRTSHTSYQMVAASSDAPVSVDAGLSTPLSARPPHLTVGSGSNQTIVMATTTPLHVLCNNPSPTPQSRLFTLQSCGSSILESSMTLGA